MTRKRRPKTGNKDVQSDNQKETSGGGKNPQEDGERSSKKSGDEKKEDVISDNQDIKEDREKKSGTDMKEPDENQKQTGDNPVSCSMVDGAEERDKQAASPKGDERKRKNKKKKQEWTFESFMHKESANLPPILLDFIKEMGKDEEGCNVVKRIHETEQYMSLFNYCSEKPKVQEAAPDEAKSARGRRSRGGEKYKDKEESVKKLEADKAEMNKQLLEARKKIRIEMDTNQKLNGRMSQLEEENNLLKRSTGKEVEGIRESVKEKDKKILDLEKELSTLKMQQSEEVDNLRTKNTNLQELNESVHKEMEDLRQSHQDLERTLETERYDKSTKYTNLKEQNESVLKDLEDLRQNHQDLESTLMTERDDNSKLQHEVNKLSKNNHKLKQELDDMKVDRDTFKDRFSQLAGAKLTSGNADITDLSDENRPQKIAEKFSELYDNQWTDAYEELMDEYKLSEEDTIKDLLETLKVCENVCAETAERQEMTVLRNILDDFTMKQDDIPSETVCNGGENEDDSMENNKDVSLSPQDKKTLLDMRKTNALWALPVLKKQLKKIVEKKGEYVKGTNYSIYLDKCVEICWYSCIQDPPLEYDFNPCADVDDALVKTYTKKGHKVDFVVWPLLRIQHAGAILAKGIVQPVAETRSKKNAA